jgi:Flp pilus assembly protein TadG
MTMGATLRRLATQRRATTTVEFALVGGMLLLLTFGTIDLGLLLWTQNALQSTTALAARCAAISAPSCPDESSVKTYAASLADDWTMPGMITASDVSVTGTCRGTAGFKQVTITTSFWASMLPPPFHNMTLTVSACYPTL